MFIPCSCPLASSPSPAICKVGAPSTNNFASGYTVGILIVAAFPGYGTSYENRTPLSPGRNAYAIAYRFFVLSIVDCTTGIPDGPQAAACCNCAPSGSANSKFPSARKYACFGFALFNTEYSSPTTSRGPFG